MSRVHGMHIINSLTYVFHLICAYVGISVADLASVYSCVCVWGWVGGWVCVCVYVWVCGCVGVCAYQHTVHFISIQSIFYTLKGLLCYLYLVQSCT